MTCIVAVTDGKRTVMGADSAASNADDPEIYNFATSKVFATGEYLVGVCLDYHRLRTAAGLRPLHALASLDLGLEEKVHGASPRLRRIRLMSGSRFISSASAEA